MLMAAGRKMIYSYASIFVEACTAALKVQTELGLVFTYFGVQVHLDRTQKHLKLFLFFGVQNRVWHVSWQGVAKTQAAAGVIITAVLRQKGSREAILGSWPEAANCCWNTK